MFDWITKPYLEWTACDTMICYVEIFILITAIIFLSAFILVLKDEIRKKKMKKIRMNKYK